MNIVDLQKELKDQGPSEALVTQCAADLEAAKARRSAAQDEIYRLDDALLDAIARQRAITAELVAAGNAYRDLRNQFHQNFGAGDTDAARKNYLAMRSSETNSGFLTAGLTWVVSGIRGQLESDRFEAQIQEAEARRETFASEGAHRYSQVALGMIEIFKADPLSKVDVPLVENLLEEARSIDREIENLKSQKAEHARRLEAEKKAVGL